MSDEKIADDGLVDYGYGRVQPHPIPERQRPVVNDNPHIQNSQDARLKEEFDEQRIRAWANQLEGGDSHTRGKHLVRIKMPSGSIAFFGGEALVSALSNGGQPMDEPKMKPTVNGEVAGYRPIQFL